ncbi:MAG: hypothetical protein ACK56K_06250 [Akkermansiaceae bacterium]
MHGTTGGSCESLHTGRAGRGRAALQAGPPCARAAGPAALYVCAFTAAGTGHTPRLLLSVCTVMLD